MFQVLKRELSNKLSLIHGMVGKVINHTRILIYSFRFVYFSFTPIYILKLSIPNRIVISVVSFRASGYDDGLVRISNVRMR